MITPIPKPGNPMLKTHYLQLNDVLGDDQQGFRKNYGTYSAILEFLTDMLSYLI